MRKHIVSLLAGAALAAAIAVTAQQRGSGLPGGSDYSTQYKSSSTTFGGTGPGTAGHVLTSNGDASAPTFQAVAVAPAITSGTFQITYPICCTTTPSQNWAYVKISDGVNAVVTVYPTSQASGTGDSFLFNNQGGTLMPAAVRPLQMTTFGASIGVDNNVMDCITATFNTNGEFYLGDSCFNFASAWTNSGVRKYPSDGTDWPSYTYRTSP